MKNTTNLFLVSLLSGITTIGAYKLFIEETTPSKNIITTANALSAKTVGLSTETIDFTEAAETALHQVVHVKNVSYRTVSNPIMEFMYGYKGGQQQQQIGTGSGETGGNGKLEQLQGHWWKWKIETGSGGTCGKGKLVQVQGALVAMEN